MKHIKALITTTALGLLFSHSTYANVTVTQKLLMPVIEMKCKSELNNAKSWKVATYFMAVENKDKLQKNICECVGRHAMDDMTAKDVLKATFSEEAKDKLVNQAVVNSLKGCVGEFIK